MRSRALYFGTLLFLLSPFCGLPFQGPTPPPITADFGDAPDPTFPSLLASDGARTLDTSQFWLGTAVNAEVDAQIVDLDPFDDGLVEVLVADQVRVAFEAAKSEDAPAGVVYFNLLADTNGDGRWQSFQGPAGPVQEWIVVNQSLQLGRGAKERIEAKFPLVGGNLEVWVRALLTDSPVDGVDWDGTGQFERGEVEDHRIGPDVWSVECDPDPLVMDHGGGDFIRLVVASAPPPDTVEVVAVSGSEGLLGDPNAVQIAEFPDRGTGPQPFGDGTIFVDSLDWAVHGFPGWVIGITYQIELKVEGSLGDKSTNCTVIVDHFAPPEAPPAIPAEGGYAIIYAGPLQARAGGTLDGAFLVTDANGEAASGVLSVTLGDPPTDPLASHSSQQLGPEGATAFGLPVKWPPGTTKLYCAFQDKVYEVAEITISP